MSKGGERVTYTVKQARMLAEKTQVEMAAAMNISRETYMKIEKTPGRATITQARLISQITGIPLDNIFFGPDST